MTTAGRPTFYPAKGGSGLRDGAKISQLKSSRDQPGHLNLKERLIGQDTIEELEQRDFKAELEAREQAASQIRALGGRGGTSSSKSTNIDSIPKAIEYEQKLNRSQSKERKCDKNDLCTPRENYNNQDDYERVDDEDNHEENYDENGEEEEEDEDEDEDDDDDEDEDDDEEEEEDEAALLAELEKIREERALERQKREMEQQERIEKSTSSTRNPSSFVIKRPWDDDIPFKNCNRGLDDPARKTHLNDTLRSSSHKKFMDKYIR